MNATLPSAARHTAGQLATSMSAGQVWTPVITVAGRTARHRAVGSSWWHRMAPGSSSSGSRVAVAVAATAFLVPVAGWVLPLMTTNPAMIAQASATPKPGSPGGNHSKPGDNKKKKKDDDKKSNKDANGNDDDSTSSGSSGDEPQQSGSSFAERTNANNRWSADGSNRSVNTRVSSQAEQPSSPQAPSQVIEGTPTQGQQNDPEQVSTPPSTTPEEQVSPPPVEDETPRIVLPPRGEYAAGEQTTTAVTPTSPSNPRNPATALVIGLAAAGAGAASRRNGSRSPATPTDSTQGVRGGFSVTHIGQADGDQTLLTLTDPDSPTRYEFDAAERTPAGGSLRVNPDQSVSILDAAGTETGEGFSAPWARDATGAAQPTQFTANGTTLTQTITPRPDAVYPITADPDEVEVGPDNLATALADPASAPGSSAPGTSVANLLGAPTPPPPTPSTDPAPGWQQALAPNLTSAAAQVTPEQAQAPYLASVASQVSGTPVAQLPPPPGSPATAQLVEDLGRPVWYDAASDTATEYWPGSSDIRQVSNPQGVTTFLGGSGSPVTAFRDATNGATTVNLGQAGTMTNALARSDGSWSGVLNGNPVTVLMGQGADGRLSGFSVTGPAQVTDITPKDMQLQNTLVTTAVYNAAGNWTRDIETTTIDIAGPTGWLPYGQSTDTVTDPILRAGTGIESWFRQKLPTVPNVPYDWHVLTTDGYGMPTQIGAVLDSSLAAADLIPATKGVVSALRGAAEQVQAARNATELLIAVNNASAAADSARVIAAGLDPEQAQAMLQAIDGVESLADMASNLGTLPNTAFFWSGKTSAGMGVGPTGNALGIAADVAVRNGGVTLEQLMANKGIVLQPWGDGTDPAVVAAWQFASDTYAAGVTGDVRAVIGTTLRANNIWESVELPRLMQNPLVTSITTIDPETGVATLLFSR